MGAGESSSIAAAGSVRRAAVSWREPLVEDVLEVPALLKPIYLEGVLHTMVQELKAVKDFDRRWAEKEAMKQQLVKQPTEWPERRKKTSLWSKVKGDMINMLPDRIGKLMRYCNRNSIVTRPHVDHQTIPLTGIIEHYELLPMIAAKGMIFHTNVLLLHRAYSEFRPVFGDGECFYRSFIFSYLEQVLDRPDTHEERCLLAAVKGVARQHAHLGWTSDFSSCRKAFKKFIKKIMRWKRHSRWKRVPSTNSYRKQKLLEFFSGYGTTDDIFAFLRLVAAIWICSHNEEYEPRVSELGEDYTLKDWCFHEVIMQRVFTDHVQITVVVTALGVPLRVEYLFQGNGQDLYTCQDPQQDGTPRSTCWPRLRHLPPPGHEVPHVTVLYTNAHYDIIYPHRRDGPLPPIDESCSQQTAQCDSPTGVSPSQMSPCVKRAKAAHALEPAQVRDGSCSAVICSAARMGFLVCLSVCNSVVSWIAGCCFGRRRLPQPPAPEFSWLSVMGSPVINNDSSCTIAAATMCIEAQHRLAFERLYGKGSFSFKVKVPSELKKLCYRRAIWDSSSGAVVDHVLQVIVDIGGILTERVPNNIKLPIEGFIYQGMNIHFGGKQFARLLYARGPLIGSLWAADSDYDITVGDQVYRGRQERFRVPGTGDYHAVVCCCYHFDSRSMELHVRIMDNHTADGPLRWILFEAFDGFWLP